MAHLTSTASTVFLLLLLHHIASLRLNYAHAFLHGSCQAPLGMESGRIPDEDISASSAFDSGNVGPRHARVRTEIGGGAWCPKLQVTTEPKEWLEVDLHSVRVITAVETQGRFGNGQGQEYAEAYLLEYWRPRLGKWVRYRNNKGEEVMMGNSNTYLEAKRELDPPMWASKVRFFPYSFHMRTVCMRVELYGCPWTEGIVSYSMPQGDKRGSGWEFFDATYDGHWDVELQRGLGQLTDSKLGPDSFKNAYYDFDRGQGWVGWRNDSRKGRPVEITFEFDQVREFTSVHLYCNNEFTKDIQVFSEVQIMFSIGGKIFVDTPITYTYMEDRIFEYARNVSIKLHHRIGRFVKLRLHFSANWIMISEVIFDSVIAHGNFTAEKLPSENNMNANDIYVNREHYKPFEIPATQDDEALMAIIIGILMAVIFLLAMAIIMIIFRHRQKKCFASPLAGKSTLPGPLLSSESSCGTVEKTATIHSKAAMSMPHPVTGLLVDIKNDDYQEPFQYYSYSSVLKDKCSQFSDSSSHEYAVPDVGSATMLASNVQSINVTSDTFKRQSPTQQEVLSALKNRLENMIVPEFPRHRLRMLSKIGEGAFRMVYLAEADGISEYGGAPSLGKRLVAVKSLPINATESEKLEFERDVRILAAIEDENIVRVLGVCFGENPISVLLEYLPHGDLCQFLKGHNTIPVEKTQTLSPKTIRINSVFFRNCLVGNSYQIKISDFGTDNELYVNDYYKMDNGMLLPIRWMAWESIYLGRYTTKSDVWAFGVTLWEILLLCRHTPYEDMTDVEVLCSLSHLHKDDESFCLLPRPAAASKDVADLLAQCWCREPDERPTFNELATFLQRKNSGFIPLA
ncbi:discoidin domain-containing receptor 2 [Nilaparvata lugens]|uniref:discoidin domain-containing receptor 2 n=1 Tax=Nilaparvata lugens TaxID=108931 RepID=UPI00193CBA2D|nr:discoidin domain-containing receptor 2 [Nilaparvata lugens]